MFETKKIYPVLEDGEEEFKIPKETDEIEAENYVLHKTLVRPSISIFTFIKYLVMFLCCVTGLSFFIYFFLIKNLPAIAVNIENNIKNKPNTAILLIIIFSTIVTLILFLKNILIGLIHLYQKYSPEEKRRSCLFKPTCSEYAVLALNKYGIIRGIPKILDRFKRCHGKTYRIDYP